ncbi:MAG: NAD(P)/FAD-dependent oxidoreductase [Halioglobus sp.]|nr:NAD(P)/FAD-dependent oxidoreductase [Halioglobus sp.]
MAEPHDFRVAIIGAGPAGIAAGRELLQQGFSDFTIFDALDAPGGTWRLHSYPGLACDVWAHSYSFSYAPNPDWSANFVGYAEIQAYLQRCATEFGLDPHLRLNTRIDSARYRDGGHWQLTTSDGDTHEFDVVINAMGNQHTPLYPDVPGMDSFSGPSWHATRWNHDVDLAGKRVAVVGSAASAVQIVPELAKTVGHLFVLQRSANWIMPRNRKPYSARTKRLFKRFPFLIRLLRKWQSTLMGQVEYAVTHGHKRMGQFEGVVRRYIDRSVDDPQLKEALLPDTHYGCKRGLVSDDFYAAFNEPHVELVASGLAEVTPNGLVTADGRALEVDVIIYCTGYRILDFDRIEVTGDQGQSLADVMADDPRAHKGIAVPGFPNYFFAVGPNGLVLNVSYFITAEQSIRTIVRLLGELRDSGRSAMDVRQQAFDDYNAWMADRFENFSWGSSDCNSYYRNASGHAPFLFPGNFKQFSRLQDESGLHEYDLAS